ncbi:peptide ABC transporter substrate-binding protein [Desulfosarcina ovata subsp. sediminis]|uniref:Peptide ABC transporter substrate-binding protein n=1 Tax=Desulfosarcina ovata subsp. sediminis TaxID=885957 RepID=A0A5K7ZUF8_9BACT|nr:ABC transporter substrate-binding protein [Desulfosarcina ovata]BBO83804.1 peptide ABC transporter substrate-binding protein [Desulfosarcina ovata subsp. sediminis]
MEKLKKLETMIKDGKLTRRQFIAATTAIGMSATLSSSLFNNKAWANTPKKGGLFRIGIDGGSAHDSSDPSLLIRPFMINIMYGQTHNNLAEVDASGNIVPELAESWETTEGAKKWIFKLRKGVEFHSGKTLDAKDVIHSINHHIGEKSKSPAKSFLKDLESIKEDDKYTVIFELKNGNADFPAFMTDYHLLIEPNGSKFDKFDGTGGYIIKEFKPGSHAITVRNPNYFKKGFAHFDEIKTLSINESISRINALRTGAVDAVNKVEKKLANKVENIPGIKLIEVESGQHFNELMQVDAGPFTDKNIRLAVKYAIDREQSVKLILGNHGYVGNDHPIGKNNRYFNSDLKQRVYDPDKAKFYLKKAGVGKLDLELYSSVAAFPGAVDHAQLYKENAAKANINIKIKQVPGDGYEEKIWSKVPFCQGWWNPRITADMMFTLVYASTAPWNETNFNNERFDKLLLEARVELDENKRKEMYGEMQKIVRDEDGHVTTMFSNFLCAASDKIKYGKIGTNWPFDSDKCGERWWFA